MHPLQLFLLFLLAALASSQDFYQMLGIGRNASTKDIKRAYRKMAAKYHPDRNKGDLEAEKMFLGLSKAHEVLTDPEKRNLYDRFGEAGVDGSYRQPSPHHQAFHFNFDDMFHQGFDDHAHHRRGSAHHGGFRFNFGDFFSEDQENAEFAVPERDPFEQFFGGNHGTGGASQRRSGGQRRCRTVQQRMGGMIFTTTECS